MDSSVEKIKEEECIDLKNIKYKTMLLHGAPLKETTSASDLSNLEKFLEDEKNNNQKEPWSKLDKTVKTKKMLSFAEEYCKEKELDETEGGLLIQFLKDCLDKKKLNRVKDVIYNKETGAIKEIPALFYNKTSRHFTLKNIDKRVSTLKSLPPKKVRGTIKKGANDDDADEDN
jgi:hypothetical protein